MKRVTINEKLIEKMRAEYDVLLEHLSSLPAEKALERAYEKVMKEDIIFSIMETPLDKRKAQLLLRQPHPLEDCYLEWNKDQRSYMPELRAAIEHRAFTLEKRERNAEAR